jgi:hypothetical protein
MTRESAPTIGRRRSRRRIGGTSNGQGIADARGAPVERERDVLMIALGAGTGVERRCSGDPPLHVDPS